MSKERPFLTNLQRRTILFSLDSISIPLVNERFEARSFNAAVKNRMLRDSRALPNQQLHPPGGGGAVDISGCPCPGRVYTRPPTVSIDIDGATRNSDGCWRVHRLVVRGTRIVLVAAVKGGNGGCCRVSTCLASINQWEWHLGEAVGKGDGEEGDAWIERPSDCSSPGRIGGRRRGRGSENGSKTLLMNGVYDGPR